MQRLAAETATVSAKQQPTTDHVDGPDDDRCPRGIPSPRAVIGELASKRTDSQRVVRRNRRQRFKCVVKVSRLRTEKLGAKSLCFGSALVDDRAAVDDIHQSPWKSRILYESKQPNGYDAGLPKAGRQIARLWEVVCNETLVQSALPREGRIAG